MRFYPKNCEKREGCKCFKCCEVKIKKDCKNDWKKEWKDDWKKECPEKKWEKREGCKCFKCCEVEIKMDCKDDWHEKKSNCHEVKWKDDSHEKWNENDRNCWIREKLDNYIGRRVVIFTNDGTHTEGTVQDVKKDYVVLVPIMNYLTFEPVKVFSNASDTLLEEFEKYYIRLDDIVGFGKDSHKYN